MIEIKADLNLDKLNKSYHQLTQFEKRMLKSNKICPECGREISKTSQFLMLKFNQGMGIKYIFYHRGCLDEKKTS